MDCNSRYYLVKYFSGSAPPTCHAIMNLQTENKQHSQQIDLEPEVCTVTVTVQSIKTLATCRDDVVMWNFHLQHLLSIEKV